MGIEDPEADVHEQRRPVSDVDEPVVVDDDAGPAVLPLEADPDDVADQRTIVPQDIDEP